MTQEQEEKSARDQLIGNRMAIGIAMGGSVGIGLGVAMHNIGTGLCLGVGLGLSFAVAMSASLPGSRSK